jgi:hypothetical protein
LLTVLSFSLSLATFTEDVWLSRKNGTRSNGRIWAIVSAALAVPGAAVAVLDFPVHESFPAIQTFIVGNGPQAIGAAATVLFSGCSGWIMWKWRLRRASRKTDLVHLDQYAAQIDYPHYSSQVRRQFDILNLSISEFAQRVGISRFRAQALLSAPNIVPRPELLPKIEGALLLPEGFFKRGRASKGSLYGTDLTKARLFWHRDRWGAAANFFASHQLDPDRNDYRKLDKVLALIEKGIEEQKGGAQ